MSGAVYIKRLGVDASIDSVVLQLNYTNGTKPLSLPFFEKSKDPIYDIRKRTDQANEWKSVLSREFTWPNIGVEADKRHIWSWYGQMVGV